MPQVSGKEFIEELAKHKIHKIVSTKWFHERAVCWSERIEYYYSDTIMIGWEVKAENSDPYYYIK